jgi:hypothetical protein
MRSLIFLSGAFLIGCANLGPNPEEQARLDSLRHAQSLEDARRQETMNDELARALTPHEYRFGLVEVVQPTDTGERYSPRQDTVQDGMSRYVFEDPLVHMIWVVTNQQMRFELVNKGDHTLHIIWDEAAYVGPGGLASRVMRQGVRFADRNASQPPTVVPRGSRVQEVVIPTDLVLYDHDWQIGSQVKPVNLAEGTAEEAAANLGKQVSVLLPLEVQGVVNEYQFIFEIDFVKPGVPDGDEGRAEGGGTAEEDTGAGGFAGSTIVALEDFERTPEENSRIQSYCEASSERLPRCVEQQRKGLYVLNYARTQISEAAWLRAEQECKGLTRSSENPVILASCMGIKLDFKIDWDWQYE